MRLRGSVFGTGAACAVLLSLTGCMHNQAAQVAGTPNPFGYMKPSSLCKVGKLQTAPSGAMTVDMTVGSDDGLCALSVTKGGGGSYVSFGVTPPPEHGKAFLYNHDGRTYIDYTATTAYSGPDQFGVELIPAHAQPRRTLTVKVTVEAVGVNGAPVAAPAKAVEKKAEPKEAVKAPAKKAVVKKTAAHKTVSHRAVRKH